MKQRHTFVNGADFAAFAQGRFDRWSQLQNAYVHHAIFGEGMVISIVDRPNYHPIIAIRFPSFGDKIFNSHSLLNGTISTVALTPELHGSFMQWQDTLKQGSDFLAVDTHLQACLHHHLDDLISGPDSNIQAMLERCLCESFSSLHGASCIESFLPVIRELRSKHPQGMSKRKSKRKTLVDNLVTKLNVIRQVQEIDWWNRIATLPIAAVVEKLRSSSAENLDAALYGLLQLPASYPYLLDETIHEFLQRAHSQLAREERVAVPLVVAHIGYLISNDEYAKAANLLERFPAQGQTGLNALVVYLRFVISPPVDLCGTTAYSTLSAEDLFLGACYYEGDASFILASQSRWDHNSLKMVLSKENNGRALNNFNVRGLQPRIAELAFYRIYGLLHGGRGQDKLRDLNLECLRRYTLPWSLNSKPNLPPADWEDGDKARYDVKCNIFYRSKQRKNGLRGFLIKVKQPYIQPQSFPCFIFTDTNDESCSWVYVGEYQPTSTVGQIEDRVLPFSLRLPESSRCILSIGDHDASLGMLLLKDPWLRIGWQLATGMRVAQTQRELTVAESLLHTFVERCLQERTSTFLEYALWKALTDVTFDACCQHDRQSVGSFLELVNELLLSLALPIRLPRFDGAPILSRWITDVLSPLNENWDHIQCAQCGSSAREKGVIQLRITQMTSEGTVYGEMTCTQCNNLTSKVTLLTHCHECNHYPLIIGKNPVCSNCVGLVCEWREHDGENRCKACKKHCGRGKHSSEASFV
jgi:hypothetical protein